MAYQSIFKRYELKYLLTTEQRDRVMDAIRDHVKPDKYGQSIIRNIYFDTDNYQLIRRSLERPAYKEKLRMRSYGRADENEPIFVELKKKYDHVVYKRRLTMPQQQAVRWLCGNQDSTPQPSQIAKEIEYFRNFYHGLRPSVFLSYRRQAWYATDDPDFRITFDDQILCRQDRLSLASDPDGTSLLPGGYVLMELKTAGSIPLWMTRVLTEEHIYKTSFSKYGTAYQTLIFPHLKGEHQHA